MNETQRLEMLVKHYEDKEKKLIQWINDRKDLALSNSTRDNYSINLAWEYYKKALMDIRKQIEVLERCK